MRTFFSEIVSVELFGGDVVVVDVIVVVVVCLVHDVPAIGSSVDVVGVDVIVVVSVSLVDDVAGVGSSVLCSSLLFSCINVSKLNTLNGTKISGICR